MQAKRIKSYGPNFALYKLESINGIRVMDSNGRDINPDSFNGIIGVRELNFVGSAKGKTGSHKLDAPNTEVIEILSVKYQDGKYNANRWELLDQAKLDKLYFQLKNFNI